MATYGQTLRRGLPRTPGGQPWPADAASPLAASPEVPAAEAPAVDAHGAGVVQSALPTAVPADFAAGALTPDAVRVDGERHPIAPASAAAAGGARTIRRGLPRVPGGEPWPPASAVVASAEPAAAPVHRSPVNADAPEIRAQVSDEPRATAPAAAVRAAAAPAAAAPSTDGARPLRRGLPRTVGGDPWPPAGFAPEQRAEVAAPVASSSPARHDATPSHPAADADVVVPVVSAPLTGHEVTLLRADAATDLSVPLPFTRTVFPGRAARTRPAPRPEPARIGPFTRLQWAGAVIVGGAGLLFAAGMAVVAVRFLLSLQPFQDFLTTYPGEYELPEGAPVGFPAWLGWQHFFNVFLMVLIIRTGLQVRREKRPSVFWSPRGAKKRKISLNLWFHQALDLLWVTNGVIFIVLLFTTGQWMRIVPTSWEVFPNAISAALQYVSLDWPTENGWVNYNSLQQLAYFATVFLAAPLAIATGVRMSGIWPKNATALNKAYPVEWARKIHFPVMLYFVAFIIVHVALVFATGALRNLNHMYAAQDAVNWVGFWIFAASMVVIAAGWIAARPLVLAPIARLFGTVSGR